MARTPNKWSLSIATSLALVLSVAGGLVAAAPASATGTQTTPLPRAITLPSTTTNSTLSPDGKTFYLCTEESVTAIDSTTGAVKGSVSIPVYPQHIIFSADGSKAYVADWRDRFPDGGKESGSIAVIDTASLTVVKTIRLDRLVDDLRLSPDGKSLLVWSSDGETVWDINPSTYAVTSTITLPHYIGRAPVFSPDSTMAYALVNVGGGQPGSVMVIDAKTGRITSTFSVVGSLNGLAFSSDGSKAYVTSQTSFDSARLVVIDVASEATTDRIEIGAGSTGLYLSPDGSHAITFSDAEGSITVINLATLVVTKSAPGLEQGMTSAAFVLGGSTALVVAHDILVVDVASATVIDRINGALATSIAVGPGGDRAWAFGHKGLGELDLKTIKWSTSVSRLAGADRYQTSIAVSDAGYPETAPVVYVATGANFPDALSAASAAARKGGPLLLTDPSALSPSVAAEITRLQPEKIVVVGDPNAVSAAVFDSLSGLAPTVTRLSGVDRYATAQAIVSDTFDSSPAVYVATGQNFPDALSASAVAGSLGEPLILVNGSADTLDTSVKNLLKRLGATSFTIAGDTHAVSSGVEAELAQLGQVTREGGGDRYATSELLDNAVFPHPTSAYFATGSRFPDALSAAVLAAKAHAPIYIVGPTCISDSIEDRLAAAQASSVTLIGDQNSLSDAVAGLTAC